MMKWIEYKPVRAGDIIQMTVCGVSGLYRVKRAARDALHLRVCDLELVERN